jgi:hypothetical protein
MYTIEEQRKHATSAAHIIQTHLEALAIECERLPPEDKWAIQGEIDRLKTELLSVQRRVEILSSEQPGLPTATLPRYDEYF